MTPENEPPTQEATPHEEPSAPPLPDTRLSLELREFVNSMEGKNCTFGDLIEMIGDRGFGLMLLTLALPAALPIPAAGYATPFGIVMALLGCQIILGRSHPWVPESFRKRAVPFKVLAFSVRNARLPLRAVEILIRPRLSGLARNRWFLAGIGFIIVAMSISMSMPIPLTNTAPSFVIFILAAGILEEDGLMLLAGFLLAPIAAGIAGLALYYAITMGPEAVEGIVKPMVKGWLGML